MNSLPTRCHKTESTTYSNQCRQEVVDNLLYGPLVKQKDAIQDYSEGTKLLKGKRQIEWFMYVLLTEQARL